MISHILLFITTWIILVLNHGANGSIENLSSEEFRILSEKIETHSSALQNKDKEITKLQEQVGTLSSSLQNKDEEITKLQEQVREIKIGNSLQNKESGFVLLALQ